TERLTTPMREHERRGTIHDQRLQYRDHPRHRRSVLADRVDPGEWSIAAIPAIIILTVLDSLLGALMAEVLGVFGLRPRRTSPQPFSTRPATASSFLRSSGSRASGAVMIALSSARSEPTGQNSCSRGKSRASRATSRAPLSALSSSTLVMSLT